MPTSKETLDDIDLSIVVSSFCLKSFCETLFDGVKDQNHSCSFGQTMSEFKSGLSIIFKQPSWRLMQ